MSGSRHAALDERAAPVSHVAFIPAELVPDSRGDQ